VSKTENDPWQRIQVGQVVDEGAEFRTGPFSRVIFQVPPDQTIILDRLGVVKLLIAKRTTTGVETNLGMPYGRTEYQVEEAGLQHDAKITSPGATLAVRGTKDMVLYDQGPFTPIAYASQPVRLRNDKGKNINFGKAGARAHVAANKNSPAEQRIFEQRMDPAGSFAGRSQSENAVLDYLARVSPDLDVSQFRLLSLITDPNFKGTGLGTLPIPGQLTFNLVWSGFSDLDLVVISPSGEVVSFKNPKVKSSGHHFGDESFDKSGQGQESVVWEKGYPQGKYTIRVSQKGGSKSGAAATVFVQRDINTPKGEQIGQFSSKISTQGPTVTHTINVGPRGSTTKRPPK